MTAAIGIRRAAIALGAIFAAGAGGLFAAVLSDSSRPCPRSRQGRNSRGDRARSGVARRRFGFAVSDRKRQLRGRQLERQPQRQAGADRRARRRAAAIFPAPDRPHRDRRRAAGAADHQHRLQRRPQFELVGPRRNAGAQPAGRATPARRRSPKSASRTAPSSCATNPTRSSRRSRTSSSSLAWPSISKSFARHRPLRLAQRDRSTRPSASPTSPRRCGATRSGLKVRLAGAPLKFGFDGYLSHRPTLKIEGTLAADTSSLRETLRWAGAPPPPGGGFGRFALKAQTNVVGGTDRALGRPYRARRQFRRRRPDVRDRRPEDAARHARHRTARPHSLRLHRPADGQRRSRLGSQADHHRRLQRARCRSAPCRPRASSSAPSSSAAPRSPPTCAAIS